MKTQSSFFSSLIFYLSGVLVALCFTLGSASAVFGFSTVVAFGDSLSDTGNVARFTDGDVWVELFADSLGATLDDRAYGGATTSYDNPAIGLPITGLQWQVDDYIFAPDSSLGDNSLFTLWAGANDFLQGRDTVQAADNMNIALEKLYGAGGREFLMLNLPDIGSTPAFVTQGDAASTVASLWTIDYNTRLEATRDSFLGAHGDANLYFVDVFTIFEGITVGSAEWLAMFWNDGFHPSSIGHEMIAAAALAATPVPEPSTVVLFGCGAVVLGLYLRRQKRMVY